jgi:hypothetical protein
MAAMTWTELAADRAFDRAVRARRRSWLMARLRRACMCCLQLAVHTELPRTGGRAGVREIPLEEIRATLEPNRAEQFDSEFRPSKLTRARWRRVWVAEETGMALPPISVVHTGDGYAIRDGHHRVSVARARGAAAITARVFA